MDVGIRIRSSQPFRELFSVAFPELNDQIWFGLGGAFDDAPQELRDQFSVNVHEIWKKRESKSEIIDGWRSRKDVFPIYAAMVSEDWNGIFATRNKSWSGLQILQQFNDEKDRASFIKKHCTVCFLNTDGAFWEFFAYDPCLLVTVENHIKKLPESTTERCSLEASHAL